MSSPRRVALVRAMGSPASHLLDPKLHTAVVRHDPTYGLPWSCSGSRSVVFDGTTDRRIAIKCYLSVRHDRAARYREISFTLAALDHPALVRVDHHPTGMSVAGQTTEVVTMPWVVGDDLLTWVAANLDAPSRIAALAGQFAETMAALEQANVAHGDLHHGNVLITPDDRLVLVDYDAMYVPALAALGPAEAGHPNYYRPGHGTVWGPHRDRYTAWTIYASLLALAIDPDLYLQVPRAGEERLLLGADDHRSLAASPVVALLDSSLEASLRDIGRRLAGLSRTDPSDVPALDPRSLPPARDRSGAEDPLRERAQQRAKVLEDHARELALVTAEEEPRLTALRARRQALMDRPDGADPIVSEVPIATGLARRLDRSVLDRLADVGITTSSEVTWSGDMVEGPTRVKGPGHRGRGYEISAADRRVIGLWKEGLKPSERRSRSEEDAAQLLASLAEEETQLLLATQTARVRLDAKRSAALAELHGEGSREDPPQASSP